MLFLKIKLGFWYSCDSESCSVQLDFSMTLSFLMVVLYSDSRGNSLFMIILYFELSSGIAAAYMGLNALWDFGANFDL
jgi:hypothetical protein